MTQPTTRRHVIWDWNGTLLDDQAARLLAVNESLAMLDIAPIDMDTYRATYCVPVPDFYAKLCGRPLTEAEWTRADDTYQRRYQLHLPKSGRLTNGARQAMLAWIARGGTQSLLSLHEHERLLADLSRHGIGTLLRVAHGRTGPTGGTKAEAMRRHLQSLGLPPNAVVAIGDAADDAVAARAAGIPIVLFAGGSHHKQALEETGAPVADTLRSAIEIASQLVDERSQLTPTPARAWSTATGPQPVRPMPGEPWPTTAPAVI